MAPVVVYRPVYRWFRTVDPDALSLYLGETQVGGYRYSGRRFSFLTRGIWRQGVIPLEAPGVPVLIRLPLARELPLSHD